MPAVSRWLTADRVAAVDAAGQFALGHHEYLGLDASGQILVRQGTRPHAPAIVHDLGAALVLPGFWHPGPVDAAKPWVLRELLAYGVVNCCARQGASSSSPLRMQVVPADACDAVLCPWSKLSTQDPKAALMALIQPSPAFSRAHNLESPARLVPGTRLDIAAIDLDAPSLADLEGLDLIGALLCQDKSCVRETWIDGQRVYHRALGS